MRMLKPNVGVLQAMRSIFCGTVQALQFRLREDLRQCGGDLGKFEQLKDMRGLEYELDRVSNRAARDKQVCMPGTGMVRGLE